MPIRNEKVRARALLGPMINDGYFPKHLVAKGQELLRQLAERIEREAPRGEVVYALTKDTAEAFNQLQEEFWDTLTGVSLARSTSLR